MTDCTDHEFIDAREDDIVAMLRELIAIPSVRGDAKDGMPFGAEVQRAYDYMLKLAKEDGFDVVDVDGYGGHIEWQGLELDAGGEILATADETLGIPVHLDVVPEGEGWSHDPYAGDVTEGRIYGRGTTDNKCSVTAVYAAMKALKESGFVPAKNVRLILGLDEETGWSGMSKYLEKAGVPDFGFAPDADFPAINGEMGVIDFELARKLEKSKEKGIILRSISGGNAANMVPDYARAIILDEGNKGYETVKEKIAAFREKTGYKLYGKGIGKAFEITAKGISAHGAHPALGLNAISILMEFLADLGIANESVRDFVEFYRRHLGFELHGESMDIGFSDEPSGQLILNVGLIGMDAEAVIVTVNVRYPVTMDEEDIYNAMLPLIHRYDLGIVKGHHLPPIYFPASDPFIETLMAVYREHSGDEESKPIVIGGGTYARAIPNAVAFGPRFPGTVDYMHQKDEYITIEELMKITHIYADAIRRLTGQNA